MKTIKTKRNFFKNALPLKSMALGVSLLSGVCFSENNVCTVNADAKGNFTSMTITSPLTSLGIEKSFLIYVDNQGLPLKGTVAFNDGVERDLKVPEEVSLMWAQFGGPQAFWDYNVKQKKVVSSASTNDLPNSSYGKQSRVFLQDGTAFIGKLMRAPNQDILLMDTGGSSPIQIDKTLLRELQQLK